MYNLNNHEKANSMAQIISPLRSDVNTQSNVSSYDRKYLSPDEFKECNTQKRVWVHAACIEGKLRGNEPAVLEALAFTIGTTGKGDVCIGSIWEKLIENGQNIHRDTVSAALKRIEAKGIIFKRMGRFISRTKRTPNYYELIGFEYKSVFYSRESSYNLNSSLDLKDHKYNTNYNEYVSFCDDSPKNKKEEVKRESKQVSKAAIDGRDPDKEVIRICSAYGLTEEKTKYAVMQMRDREKMNCAARYLSNLAKRLAKNEWQMKPEPKPQYDYQSEGHGRWQQDCFRARAQEQIDQTMRYLAAHEKTEDKIVIQNIIAEVRRRNEQSRLDN